MSAGDYIALIGLIVTIVIAVAGVIATWAVMGQRTARLETFAHENKDIYGDLKLIQQRVAEHERRLEGHSATLDTVKQMEGDVRRLVQDVEEIRGLLRELLPARQKPPSEADALLSALRSLLLEKQRAHG